MLENLRYLSRQLRRSPGYAAAVTLTLALAIGVNAAVFSLLDGFLLRKLPYPAPERIGVLMAHIEGVSPRTGQFITDESDSHDGETWELVKSTLTSATPAAWGGT